MARWHVEKRVHLDGKSVSYRVKAEMPCDATGKRRTKSGTFSTRKEADAAGREWSRDADNGIIIKTSTATIADVSCAWLDVKRPALKPRTLTGYEATLKRVTDEIGALPIQRMQPTNIDAFYALLREGGASEDAVHRVHQRLLQVFDYATKRRIIAVNPMHAIDAPIVRSESPTILTAPQIGRFLAYAAHCGYSPLWLLILQTGMRRGEALGLRWRDVDFDTGTVSVRQAVEVKEVPVLHDDGTPVRKEDGSPKKRAIPSIQTPKTPATLRTITLFPESVAALKAHRTRQRERQMCALTWEGNDLVFTTRTGGMLNPNNVLHNLVVIQRKANDAARKANDADAVLPRFDIHDLRHTHASHLIRSRWDIVTVSCRLGHANPAITMRIYAHALADVPDGDLVTPAALAGTVEKHPFP